MAYPRNKLKNLWKEVQEWTSELTQTKAAENTKRMKEQLGDSYAPLMDQFTKFGEQQVAKKHWTEAQRQDYEVMVYDADSAKVMADLIQANAKNTVNFSPSSGVSNSPSYEDVVAMTVRGHLLKESGKTEEGEELIRKAHKLNESLYY